MDARAIQELCMLSHSPYLYHLIMVQAVLKRVLRVSHSMLQLHILKLIKSQVPFCGRKWRQCKVDIVSCFNLTCECSKYEGYYFHISEL